MPRTAHNPLGPGKFANETFSLSSALDIYHLLIRLIYEILLAHYMSLSLLFCQPE